MQTFICVKKLILKKSFASLKNINALKTLIDHINYLTFAFDFL